MSCGSLPASLLPLPPTGALLLSCLQGLSLDQAQNAFILVGGRGILCGQTRSQGWREAPRTLGSTCPSSKQDKDFNPCPKQVGLRPGHSSESPGEQVRMQIAGPHLQRFGFNGYGTGPENVHFPDTDFASSQIRLMLLVWGPHFANHCPKSS